MFFSLSLEKFNGKVAVVTGASSGLGKSISEALVKNGLKVAALGRRIERLEEHVQQLKNEKGKLYPFQCDVTDQQQILSTFKKIIAELGPIYILINNAGVVKNSPLIDGDIEKWKITLDTNLLPYAICSREAIRNMKLNNTKGHLINMNSVLGHMVPAEYPKTNLYAATKHAITAFTETLRIEIIDEKLPIKITSVSPGFVETEIVDADFPHIKYENVPHIKVEDVADAVLYILSTPDHVNVKELIINVQGALL